MVRDKPSKIKKEMLLRIDNRNGSQDKNAGLTNINLRYMISLGG